ncbi:palmitoyltransferase Hip14 [Osmia lignaria lignaria]|uniref:palmitoyltransferase Hip14 n=1 Tax=Osmia lignaria lignaria TaxID=1437193 RepID=UPI0014789968|nr:ankyrin repeat domain-containing protein 39-like isoform X1 [Osmia lignaria]XP_034190715.1 ankyrin repeat domain-containing protein 39-like isoform X1 [Osmia lignaria]XP_034190716.1 ankyrin repeat domain-containing protein 39-like isoform X1 [Osmia lignaria]XP_034190718.1 ankyrin repeat domain-containing protein 39-like isoform X1 [Osmia lignaria]XP_034190719.1 ankyrin repeat domain-containing protein 39-like isoform X1 [Osmia lignaria]XP_034190720.1 ankyrin repeat domain-containing protein
MEHHHGSNDRYTCCSSNNNHDVRQSLMEMEFERGIWYAAQYNDLDRVKALLKKGTPIDAEDFAGYTALHYAARNGNDDICKFLIENGAAVNARTRCGRATPLHRAAMQGHSQIVRLLLKSGANPNLQDADGCTALHKVLVTTPSIPVCKLLVPRTDLTLQNNNKQSVKQLTQEKCPEILQFISTYE